MAGVPIIDGGRGIEGRFTGTGIGPLVLKRTVHGTDDTVSILDSQCRHIRWAAGDAGGGIVKRTRKCNTYRPPPSRRRRACRMPAAE